MARAGAGGVPVRKVRLRWDHRPVPRHFMGDDLVLSHTAAVMSSMFPEGEAFFVRSVRHYRSQITDPDLAARVAGFIGQESMHAREHRALNVRLAELGYPTRRLEKRAGLALRTVERLAPPKLRLAITVALEHATATLAFALLSSDDVQALMLDEQIRSLVLWHALEESEHKAVAFDVYEHIGAPQWLLRVVLRVGAVTSTLDLLAGLLTTLPGDPQGRDPRAIVRSMRALRRSPFAGLGLGRLLLDFQRPGFHPDDHDTAALIEEWSKRLFAEGGSLQQVAVEA